MGTAHGQVLRSRVSSADGWSREISGDTEADPRPAQTMHASLPGENEAPGWK